MRRAALALAIVVLPARAYADPAPAAPAHLALGVGGYLALAGPARLGGAAELELYPGGAWGRWGVRAATLSLDRGDYGDQLLTAGATFSAASARPHLHLALHADAGARVGVGHPRPAIGGGLQSELGLVGPLAVGSDVTLFAVWDDDGPALILAVATTLRLSF